MRNTPLNHLCGTAAPLLRANVDTDAIAPSRVKMTVDSQDLTDALFREWRDADPDFVLNRPERAGAAFLVSLDNFGCGSSRETAVWALRDYGFRCVVAPSFGAIFQANCARNGVAPIVLDRGLVEALGAAVEADAMLRLELDLTAQRLSASNGFEATFAIDPGPKRMLIEGLDSIGLTLTLREDIEAFRASDRQARPWVYALGCDGALVEERLS